MESGLPEPYRALHGEQSDVDQERRNKTSAGILPQTALWYHRRLNGPGGSKVREPGR
jgi:hypothetical protein